MTNLSIRRLLPAIALVMVLPAAAQGVDTYKIDAVHSNVGFRIRHLVSKVTGRFGAVQGQIQVNNADPSKSSVDVTIDAASISTGVDARDNHLRADAFFDVAKYPTLTFKSTAVKEVAKGQLEVIGAFTMHGVTKVITIPVTNLGTTAGMTPGSVIGGFEGSLKLNRSDYGMKFMVGPLGDEVEITLNIEAVKINK